VLLLQLDRRQLRAAGVTVSPWLGFFLAPVYLYQRAKRLNQTQWPAITWGAALVLSLGVYAFGANAIGAQVSTAKTESAITEWLVGKGYPDASVSCPSVVLNKPGATFDCVANSLALNGTIIQVTIQNTAGDIVWKVSNLP
jgi:hypothetical protein